MKYSASQHKTSICLIFSIWQEVIDEKHYALSIEDMISLQKNERNYVMESLVSIIHNSSRVQTYYEELQKEM